jgi:hypothetical protein
VLRTFLVRTEQFANLSRIGDLRGRTVIVTKGSTSITAKREWQPLTSQRRESTLLALKAVEC